MKWIASGILSSLLAFSLCHATTLEIPGPGTIQSGVGVISGWKCEVRGQLTVRFDGGQAIPLAYKLERRDTASACGDADNGFVSIWNWSNLEAGEHTVVAYDNGREFARSTFTVVTPGVEFLRDVTGTGSAVLSNGQQATLQWDEASQRFVVVEFSAEEGLNIAPFNPRFVDQAWGEVSAERLQYFIEPAYYLLMELFGVQELDYPLEIYQIYQTGEYGGLFNVIHRGGHPIYRIGIAEAGTFPRGYVETFAHELAHALTNSDLGYIRHLQWFEETLANLASLFVLYEIYEQRPYEPYEGEWEHWRINADYVRDTGRAQLAAWGVEDGAPVASWFEAAWPHLVANRHQPLNWAIIRELLPYFQANPELWRACAHLNFWDVSKNGNLAEYLTSWERILQRSGESTELISILRRIFYGSDNT